MLKLIGLDKRLNHYPNEVSGGEKQRIAVVRALINKPSIVLADEPTGNLDKQNTTNVINIIKDLVKHYIISFVIATHNLSITKKFDKVIKLSEEYGLKISQRSKKQPVDPNTDLYLCDTIGELGLFYRSANLVFVGGSLIEHGGQNPIEALHHNTEILHGPNIENFEEIYDTLKRINVAFTVTSQKEIEQKIKEKYNRDGLKKPSVTNTSFADEGKKVFQKTILEIDKFLPKKHHD